MVDVNRDSRGRFVKGHKAIPPRDKNGRFIPMESMDRKQDGSMEHEGDVAVVENKVDKILREHGL